MGRTVPSFRMLLEGLIEELSAFRRALRGEDRNVFDSLMNKAREHASSCTVAPLLDPMEAIFLSIYNDGRTGHFGWFKRAIAREGFGLIQTLHKEPIHRW